MSVKDLISKNRNREKLRSTTVIDTATIMSNLITMQAVQKGGLTKAESTF